MWRRVKILKRLIKLCDALVFQNMPFHITSFSVKDGDMHRLTELNVDGSKVFPSRHSNATLESFEVTSWEIVIYTTALFMMEKTYGSYRGVEKSQLEELTVAIQAVSLTSTRIEGVFREALNGRYVHNVSMAPTLRIEVIIQPLQICGEAVKMTTLQGALPYTSNLNGWLFENCREMYYVSRRQVYSSIIVTLEQMLGSFNLW
ncbi:hypothetical protein Tco_0434738 [Tanacetum coccineum]